ncbi:AzlD domain-containing protein [Nocardioides sp.]|uniref:AzlD domain-containing protein n=1 Tax=Nocardioides sp. TaxID=35761 RepID=UPI003527A49C
MMVLLTFTLAAVVTFALRAWMTVAGGRLVESERFAELTALVTPAVLAAMIASALLLGHGHATTPAVASVAAVVAAFAVVRRTGNVGLGLALGLAVNACLMFVGLG